MSQVSVKQIEALQRWAEDRYMHSALDDLMEARALIERMKDQMTLEIQRRGVYSFTTFYKAAIADAVKFLKEEDDGNTL